MSEKTDFLKALRVFKGKVKEVELNPINSNIIMTYDHETHEIIAKREDGGVVVQGDPPGTGGGGGLFPP